VLLPSSWFPLLTPVVTYWRFYSQLVFITHKYSTLQLSSVAGSPNTKTIHQWTDLLQWLHYSTVSQETPWTGLSQSGFSTTQNRTLQQSIFCTLTLDYNTALHSDPYPLLVKIPLHLLSSNRSLTVLRASSCLLQQDLLQSVTLNWRNACQITL
jgi:hypothetical protein